MGSPWPLTGRARELGLIAAAVSPDSDVAGVMIGGEAGVGKTRLAREALDRSSLPSRWVSASTSAQSVPLGALAPWVPRDSANQIAMTQDVVANLAGGVDGNTIVAVDDAHLLDDLSVFVLQQIVTRRLARVVVVTRTGEAVQDTIAALWTDGHLKRIDVEALPEQDCLRLVEAVLGGRLEPTTAQQLWRLTRGNALYLRHIVESELDAGRLQRHRGTWQWTGELVVSPSLRELIARQMGSLPADVAMAVDLLAVGEPLRLDTLSELVDAAALERAEALRLTTVDITSTHAIARLAHPLYGEARKATAGPLRLRRLRGLVASALAKEAESDVRTALRRAVLILDSDVDADPAEMLAAAETAIRLADGPLALRLSQAAVQRGGGWPAQLAHAANLTNLGHIDEASTLLVTVAASDVPEPVQLQADFLRVWALQAGNRPSDAESALAEMAQRYSGPTAAAAVATLKAVVAAAHGDAIDAITAADAALGSDGLPELATMMAMMAKVLALSQLGRLPEMRHLHEQAHALARSAQATVMPLTTFTEFYVWGLRTAGCIAEARKTVDAIREVTDGPTGLQWTECITAGVELAHGCASAAAQRLEWTATAVGVEPLGWPYRYGIDQTAAQAIAGQTTRAVHTLGKMEATPHSCFAYLTPQRILASAWVLAAQGWVSGAIAEANRAALEAAAYAQPIQEVLCLQVATQFGDTTTAARLAELAANLDVPRAAASAAHAAALAVGDGSALDAASRQYEAMGDLLAAADSAAQAGVAHRRAGRRGDARVSTQRAHRLAETCGGAITPSLGKTVGPVGLTDREREIVAMVAQGMSNREIARRLSVSVRTVEGHLYRASVRTHSSSRAELTALLRDQS